MRTGDLAGYFNHFGALGLGHSVVAPLKTQYIPTGDNRKPLAVYQGWNPTLSAIQSALVILYIAFRSKYGLTRAKCGDLHL
jgi:hypothetical protein